MMKYDSVFCQTLWKTGKVPCPILDFHGHMHSYVSAAFPAAESHQMIETMNRCGTRWLFFCSHLAMYDPVYGEAIQREAVSSFGAWMYSDIGRNCLRKIFSAKRKRQAAWRLLDSHPGHG